MEDREKGDEEIRGRKKGKRLDRRQDEGLGREHCEDLCAGQCFSSQLEKQENQERLAR